MEELNLKLISLSFDKAYKYEDALLPEIEEHDNRISVTANTIIDIFGKGEETKKRSNTDNRSVSKKLKYDDNEINYNTISDLLKANTLNILPIKQLKLYLQSKGIQCLSTLKKDSLIDKIMEIKP